MRITTHCRILRDTRPTHSKSLRSSRLDRLVDRDPSRCPKHHQTPAPPSPLPHLTGPSGPEQTRRGRGRRGIRAKEDENEIRLSLCPKASIRAGSRRETASSGLCSRCTAAGPSGILPRRLSPSSLNLLKRISTDRQMSCFFLPRLRPSSNKLVDVAIATRSLGCRFQERGLGIRKNTRSTFSRSSVGRKMEKRRKSCLCTLEASEHSPPSARRVDPDET